MSTFDHPSLIRDINESLAPFRKGQPEAILCLAYGQPVPAGADVFKAGDFVALPMRSLDAVRAAVESTSGPALASQRLDILLRP